MWLRNRQAFAAGFSFVELLIVLAIVGILLAVAVPNLMTAHRDATETVVIREIQSIHQAQIQYLSAFGDYAPSLAHLGPPRDGAVGPHGAKLIPASLAGGEKNGYRFTVARTPSGFAANATPKAPRDGQRSFYIDEDGVVRFHRGPGPATAASPEIH